MVTKIRFTESSGECKTVGTIKVEHNFENEEDLLNFIQDNWLNLEDQDVVNILDVDISNNGDLYVELETIDED